MMRDYLSRTAASVTPYTAGEQPQDRSYIKLNTNENPYPPSPGVARFLEELDPASLRLYPDPEAAALRAAIAEVRGVSPENVFCGNGSDEVLAHVFQAFFDPDSLPVVFPDITYSFYPVYANLYGIRARTLPLAEGFVLNRRDYLSLNGAQGIVIANPNAPTGRGLSRDEIEEIIASNPERAVVVDEAYMDFFGQSAVPLVARYPNLAVVQTFSKSYSLAGIRCGYAVAQRPLIEGLERIKDSFNSYPLDRVCQGVCAAAVRDAGYYADCVKRVVSTRERAAAALENAGCAVVPSQANFLFVKPPVEAGLAYRSLKERGILVRYFAKPGIDGYLRVTVGTDEEMDRLTEAVAAL